VVPFLGARLDTQHVDSWAGAIFLALTGLGLFELTRRSYSKQWNTIQEEIERDTKRRETA
jgi:branched-chain amino acid transport system permease protein